MVVTTDNTERDIPARLRDDHLSTKLMKLVPQLFGLQTARDRRHLAISDVISRDTRHLVNCVVVIGAWRHTADFVYTRQYILTVIKVLDAKVTRSSNASENT